MYQIGGEIQINDLDLGKSDSIFEKNVFYLSHGRAAINLILRSIKISGTFLLPSYLCDSIIQPFVSNNIKIDFYEVDNHLNINLDNLQTKLNYGNIQGVYTINYFGFLYESETVHFLNNIKHKVLIIEDYSHGSLLETKRQNHIGHFIFSSLRKYLPVPDGCVLINKSQLELNQKLVKAQYDNFFRLKYAGRILKSIFEKDFCKQEVEDSYLKLLNRGEELLNSNSGVFSISDYSLHRLNFLDLKSTLIVRQGNYKKLQSLFIDTEIDNRFFTQKLDVDISPFMFPVRVRKDIRDKLRGMLSNKRLFCSILWPSPEVLDKAQFPRSVSLSEEILCLPIDQRYNIDNMIDIYDRFMKEYYKIRKKN